MKVFAIITLAQPISAAGSDRWGPFLRVAGERNHWWLGKKLTIDEFNAEFPKAVRFAGPQRPLVGYIYVENEEGASAEPVEPVAMITVAEHDAKIADIQAGVDQWQETQNAKLQAALAQIEALEAQIATMQATAAKVIEESADKPAASADTTTISEGGDGNAAASTEGNETGPAGAQDQLNSSDSAPDSNAAAPPGDPQKKEASKVKKAKASK